jgi:glycosyltransferase involved in cell wall biosynthesis
MNQRARLRLIGDGPDADALHRQAGAQGLANRIEWLPPQPQHALATHYRQATIVAVPSIEEGLGMVAVEAQLCGATVVASASGGLPDVVQDGRTGRLVPPGSPDQLARVLDALIANPAMAATLGAEGRKAALATYSPDVVAAQYAELYRQALHAR